MHVTVIKYKINLITNCSSNATLALFYNNMDQ